MIVGLGVDIVDVQRINKWCETPALLSRFFSEQEISDVKNKGKDFALSLAARFAAKEAFGKALGTGLEGITLKDIRIKNNVNGKPDLVLKDSAENALSNAGGGTVFVSLSHEKNNAVAVVVIEKV